MALRSIPRESCVTSGRVSARRRQTSRGAASSGEPYEQRIQELVDSARVVLFMKGNAQFPQCGFSNTVVQVLNHHGVPFKAVNVLDDAQLKESLKTFSQWPTIPQLYLNGEFYGGCDIVLEGFEDGTLEEELEIALTS